MRVPLLPSRDDGQLDQDGVDGHGGRGAEEGQRGQGRDEGRQRIDAAPQASAVVA